MTTQASVETGDAPLGGFDALIAASARSCPDAILFRDDSGAATARNVARRVSALAEHFRQCGLRPSERILLVMGADTRSLVALSAALRAGLEPALVPCGLGPIDIAAYARTAHAVAIVGSTHYGSLAIGESYLSAAALSDTIRLVATLGPEAVDGAVDLSIVAGDHAIAASEAGSETLSLLTFEATGSAPALVSHRQTALFSAALSLVGQARINPAKSILSTIIPASLAGLVAGPFAALLGASSLTLHGPFDAAGFLATTDAEPGAHLVVPAAIAPSLVEAGLGGGEASLILLSRFASPTAFVLPAPVPCTRPVLDLYAFGEAALLPRPRSGGVALQPSELLDGSLPGPLGHALNRARLDRAMGG